MSDQVVCYRDTSGTAFTHNWICKDLGPAYCERCGTVLLARVADPRDAEIATLRSALASAEERAREAERERDEARTKQGRYGLAMLRVAERLTETRRAIRACRHVVPDLLSGEAMICGKCGAVYLMDGQGWRAPETKGTEAAPVSPESKGATRG